MGQLIPAEPWIIDADGHVVEPAQMWDDYLPRRFRSYAPGVLQQEDHFRFICNDRLGFRIAGRHESVAAPGQTPHRADTPVPATGATDPAARLADMAIDQIGVAVLYPTYGLMIQGVTETPAAIALCQAVNNWLHDYCKHDPTRLIGIGVIPMTDPAAALEEARRCVESLGFRGVWRRPEQIAGLPQLQDPGYERLWSYLEEADVPLAFHPGVSGLIPFDYLADRYGDYFSAIHAAHFAVEQMMALTSMVAYGILEQHPSLRVAFLECGASWIVSYLHRLDEHLETFGFDRGKLTSAPSETFARQGFVSAEDVEPGLALAASMYPRSVVFASDYPHGDGTFPGSTKSLLETTELTKETITGILDGNARRLYALDERVGAARR